MNELMDFDSFILWYQSEIVFLFVIYIFIFILNKIIVEKEES